MRSISRFGRGTSHTNTGTGLARYLACENAPLLQNIGGIALRQEIGKHITVKTTA